MADEVRRIFTQHFIQMGGDGRAGIDHGVAHGPGVISLRGFNPNRFQTKRRLQGFNAFELAIHLARVDGQITAHFDIALAPDNAFENNAIRIRIDVEVIANANGLDQKAQFGRQFLSDTFDSTHELATGFRVHQGNEAVADIEANQVDLVNVVPVQFFGRLHFGRIHLRLDLGLFFDFTANHHESNTRSGRGQGHKDHVWHARHQAQDGQNARGNEQS